MKLLLILFTSAAIAQTINPRAIAVNADAETAFRAYAITQVDPAAATGLSLAMDAVATAVRVDSGATIKVNDAIKIDNEVMIVTAKAGRDLTVTRGGLGTTAATHDAGAAVNVLKYPSLQEFARAVAITGIRDLVARYLPDVNASAAAVEATRKTKMDAAAQ